MVKDGPELVRFLAPKNAYRNVLLVWEYDGANWTHSPEEGRSGATVIVPELEEWLWHNAASICKLLECDRPELIRLTERFCIERKQEQENVVRTKPKELFNYVLYELYKRQPLPRDFEQIAKVASMQAWRQSASFARVVSILQNWFRKE